MENSDGCQSVVQRQIHTYIYNVCNSQSCTLQYCLGYITDNNDAPSMTHRWPPSGKSTVNVNTKQTGM